MEWSGSEPAQIYTPQRAVGPWATSLTASPKVLAGTRISIVEKNNTEGPRS